MITELSEQERQEYEREYNEWLDLQALLDYVSHEHDSLFYTKDPMHRHWNL